MTKDVQPFFPTAPSPTRSLGAALPALATALVTSPWSPRPAPPPAPAAEPGPTPADLAELAALRDEARTQGRTEGLAETAALRARLSAALAATAAPPAEIVAPAADMIAEVATCVIEAWLGHADRSALFAPIVRAWLARSPAQPATARVHPDDATALAAAVGDAPLAIAGDPAIAPGALEISSATLELRHDWRTRLDELRTAIAAALTGDEP